MYDVFFGFGCVDVVVGECGLLCWCVVKVYVVFLILVVLYVDFGDVSESCGCVLVGKVFDGVGGDDVYDVVCCLLLC